MIDLLKLLLAVVASLFKSRAELEAENLVLRQQVNVLRRRMPKRPALTNIDRLLFVCSIAGSPRPQAPLRSSDPRRSFAGTALAFGPTGDGDRAIALADRKRQLSCGLSLAI